MREKQAVYIYDSFVWRPDFAVILQKFCQLQGASPPDPHRGPCLWTPLGDRAPDPRLRSRLVLNALAIGPPPQLAPRFVTKFASIYLKKTLSFRGWEGLRSTLLSCKALPPNKNCRSADATALKTRRGPKGAQCTAGLRAYTTSLIATIKKIKLIHC